MAALIAAQREEHRIPHATACRALGVSRSWSCKWKDGQLPPRAARRDRLKAEVRRLFDTHGGIRQSMGRPGSALDNAVIEAWHSTLEFELRAVRTFATRAQARAAVAAWTGDYNHVRRHSALGMVSPVDYERSLAGRDAA